jgi:translation initiation factor 2D
LCVVHRRYVPPSSSAFRPVPVADRERFAFAREVAPLPGKNAGLEVMVQGKQIRPVTDMLVSKGVPEKWIEAADMTTKKK